jgi:biopolymer transport protein ExbD
MNLRKRHKLAAEVNASSLNDIMFFLLLFFLITSTLVSPNVIKLLLPNANSGKAVNKQSITVTVSKDLEYYVDRQQVQFEGLQDAIASAAGGKTEPTVILKLDREVPVQNLVNVLDIGNKLKIKMILATQMPKK